MRNCVRNKCARCLEVSKLDETAVKCQFTKRVRYYTKVKREVDRTIH